MAHLLLLNGPNLNLLGRREPEVYGTVTLSEIESLMQTKARELGHELESYQSNAEHALIDKIHAAKDVAFILLNPGAFTHTSVAMRDALLGVGVPFIELHLSNVAARESFRRRSYFADVAVGSIAGFGVDSYELALMAANAYLARKEA